MLRHTTQTSTRRLAAYALAAVLTLACMMGQPASAVAVPATTAEQTFAQPDGSSFTGYIKGDECFSWYVTSAGTLIQKDPATSTWRQVTRASDGALQLGPAAQDSVDDAALTGSDLTDSDETAYRELSGATVDGDGLSASGSRDLVTLDSIQSTTAVEAESLTTQSETSTQATKSIPVITIVVGFDDVSDPSATYAHIPYNSTYDWGTYMYSGEYSLTAFYSQMSDGQFTWLPASETCAYGTDGDTNTADAVNDGIVHVTIDHAHPNISSDFTNAEKVRGFGETLSEALQAAAPYVDFASFDTNHDGKLENDEVGICFVIAGYEASTTTDQPSIWAHQSKFTQYPTSSFSVDGVEALSYVAVGEDMYDGEVMGHNTIGTFTHELGHYLGLPDLYDSTNLRDGAWKDYTVGGMSTMDMGANGSTLGGEIRPVDLDAYCRTLLGFVTPTRIDQDGTYTVTSQTDAAGYTCYRIDVSADEYYLIENREYESFDEALQTFYFLGQAVVPSNLELYPYANLEGGIVAWHVDDGVATRCGVGSECDKDVENTVNVTTHRPGVMPIYPEVSSIGGGRALWRYPFMNKTTINTIELGTDKLLKYDGSDDLAARVDSGITISTSDDGATSMTFTVDFPDTVSTLVAGGSCELAASGATLSFSSATENVSDTLTLQVFDADGNAIDAGWAHVAYPVGADGTATGSIAFPANTGTDPVTYTVRVLANGTEVNTSARVTVTVAGVATAPEGSGTQETTTTVRAATTSSIPATGDGTIPTAPLVAVGTAGIALAAGLRRRQVRVS